MNSVNFITCHDGFTLNDLVSYKEKHNEANGEENRDGTNDNNSWNCGADGETDDPAIRKLRARLVKNHICFLIFYSGTPMVLGGDEFRRTQKGNNNAYCQDNEISWFDWTLAEKNADILACFRKAIDTSLRSGNDFHEAGAEVPIDPVDSYPAAPRSTVVLVGT